MNPDIVQEAQRIVAEATEVGITLRLLGGLAVRLRSLSAAHRALERSYPDIDFATPRTDGPKVDAFLQRLGYEPNKAFNLLNGQERLLFYDLANERQIDVFVGSFTMCHRLPITERLATETLTLPLAELCLTKLQIVEANQKDLQDLYALLLAHPMAAQDGETINGAYIAILCAKDWGLYKTVLVSLDRLQHLLPEHAFDVDERDCIVERIEALRTMIKQQPKGLQWKLRAQVGERVRWYDLPEEVRR